MNEDVDSPVAAEQVESDPAGDADQGTVHEAPQSEREPADLDAISRDLDGVEAALTRLADGTYWTDEVTGEPIPDEVLAADPVARRADAGAASA